MSGDMHRLEQRVTKQQVIDAVSVDLERMGLKIVDRDVEKPWGAFFRVADDQIDKFVARYFDGVDLPESAVHGNRSPKILIVAPGQRLSWQYHHRRGEVWRAWNSSVGYFESPTNEQPRTMQILGPGESTFLREGIRHRLVGLDEWGEVAEIWIHSDADAPSNEEDIVRLEDDFGRQDLLPQ